MTIIFFVGQGVTEKAIHTEYKNGKYIKNNFINKLKKITNVIIPDIPYHHIYYYQKNDIDGWKARYNKIKKLNLDDIFIQQYIKNLKIDKRKKYIVMGHSDGIYFAMEFAIQYPKLVKEIISLDGSWITNKLCKQRLINWKKRDKKVKLIKKQEELNNLMVNIIENQDNDSIRHIFNHTRFEHTKVCIESNYQNIIKKIKYTSFRNFNSYADNDDDEQFNEYAILENDVLSKLSDIYQIFWQVDAGHGLWFNELYKNQIVNYINCQYK